MEPQNPLSELKAQIERMLIGAGIDPTQAQIDACALFVQRAPLTVR